MSNRIRDIIVRNRRVDPFEAEVWIRVVPETMTPATEIRGRLVGPRCRYGTTIEVAYPLKSLTLPAEGQAVISKRIIIPEPSLWEPTCPFIYQGPVELWEDGVLSDQIQITHGLRTIHLGTRGMRLNGKSIALHALSTAACSEIKALRCRQAGYNTLVVPVTQEAIPVWDVADRIGFLVLGRISASDEAHTLVTSLRCHPSCLGWILSADIWGQAQKAQRLLSLVQELPELIWGVEWWDANQAIPPGIHFILCAEESLPSLVGYALPKMVWSEEGELPADSATVIGNVIREQPNHNGEM